MKKHRISKRIFAMLLVICMVFTMMPANVQAYVKGDIEAGDMGMDNIQDEKITWPIEIYDYSNDGMLFEYASYTGNTASWAQLDKNEEYCYIPELNAQYYADYTTDAINNTQVVRRWFDVCNTTYAQVPDSTSGLKYFTFTDFAGKETELIDFRDPNSDAVIDLYDRENNTIGGYTFSNAYGYTFIIDDIDGVINGGDATIITTAEKYSVDTDTSSADVIYDCNQRYAANVQLRPTENSNEYEVVASIMGTNSVNPTLENFDWIDGDIMLLVHGGDDENRMDRVAAGALKTGDKVTLSKSIDEAAANAEGMLITVEADENGKNPGTVSSDDVKYATLVYKTQGGAATNDGFSPTYANGYDWTAGVAQIYVFANTTGTSPGLVCGEGNETLFGNFYGILLTKDASGNYVVTDVDWNADGTNTIGTTALTADQIAILFHPNTATTHEWAFNKLKKYGVMGRPFAFTAGSMDALQTATGSIHDGTTATYTLSTGIPVDETGTMSVYFREAGSETPSYRTETAIPLAGYDLGSGWRYCVLDLSGADISEIQSAGIYLHGSENTYDLMVSHFALFGSEAEAESYGEKALVYNKHHIQTLYPNNATYSTDFTTSEVAGATTLIKDWWIGEHLYTEGNTANDQYLLSYDDTGRQHYSFTGSSKWKYPAIEMIDFNAIDGVSRDKLKYAVLVYRTTDVSSGTEVDLYFRNKSTKNEDGSIAEGGCWYVYDEYAHPNTFVEENPNTTSWENVDKSGFVTVIYDLTKGFDAIPTEDQKIYSAGIRLTTHGTDAYDGEVGLDEYYTFDIRQFAFFDNKDDADAYADQIQVYNQYTEVPASYYNPIYDNLGYGLLTMSREDASMYDKYDIRLGYNIPSEILNGTSTETTHASKDDMIYYLATNTSNESTADDKFDLKNYSFDEYQLLGTLTEGGLTAGLLKGALGSNGNPEYRDQVIEYLAELLRSTLTIPEYEGGYFNYEFVRGEASYAYGNDLNQDGELNDESIDLATAIRRRLEIDFEKEFDYETNKTKVDFGTVADSQAKADKLIGTWAKCKDNIETCCDAAYYLLHNLFVKDSYNETPEHDYSYLTLHKATLDSGKDAYVFDAGLTKADGTTAIIYDTEKKLIDYAGAVQKDLYYTSAETTTTLFPFLPITADNNEEGMTKSPYFADPGVGYDGTYGETYYNRDFNYVIKSHGEFVYHEDDGLFFDFEGDDDVYLFINGQLVLDIGGAHSITKQNINVNDYVQAAYDAIAAGTATDRDRALALEDGQVCTFDFFYMERHGYGANCRIATNLRVTDPAMHVEKTAYQSGEEVNYGGIVVENELVEYQFSLTNTGNTKLYNISFYDPAIGVRLDPVNGLTVSKDESVVCGSDKSPLDYADLTAVVTGYKEVDDGTGNYIEENGVMVEVAVGEGTHIFTENEIKFADNDAVKAFMRTLKGDGLEQDGSDTNETGSGGGLWIHSTLVIKGIYYRWQDKDKAFSNTVYVEATTTQDGTDTLRSQASHRIFVPSDPFYYQWSGHEIIITPDTLVKDILANAQTEDDPFFEKVNQDSLKDGNSVTDIIETSYTGNPITTQTVTIDDDNNVTVNYDAVGTHVFYLKVSYGDNLEVKVPVVVHVTNVENSYMVLDYGLAVDLTQDDEIFKYDTITVSGRETAAHLMAITGTKPEYNASYGGTTGDHRVTVEGAANTIEKAGGTFNLSGSGHEFTLTYTPDKFMEAMDTIWAAVAVHDEENNEFTPNGLNETVDIRHEVQMFKEIGVLPANVVYYEDDFPAITYTNVGNSFEQVDSSDDGTHQGSSGLYQSPDQEQEYGKDSSAYGTNAEMSGNSITKITINDNSQVASFKFKGTGFELISRTNAYDSAKITVIVEDKGGNRIKVIPVITEFDHNGDDGKEEIYQVPVIRVDDLDYGTYTVKISGIPTRDYTKNAEGKYLDPTTDYTKLTGEGTDDAGKYPYVIPTILYIDGLRIFNPLAETVTNVTTDEETGEEVTTTVVTPGKNPYYNDAENGAVFKEIRDLVVNAQAAVAEYYYDSEESRVSYGTVTWTENRNNSTSDGNLYIGKQVSSVDDYLAFGPNNEVYMAKDDNKDAALVFYVQENRAGANLQIAARAIDNGLFMNGVSTTASAELEYAVMQDGNIVWKPLATITGATEQYYTIDYSECPYIVDKGFQVAIKVTEGMVSYSSLKCNGLDINQMSSEFESTTLKYENGILVDAETGEETDTAAVPAFRVLVDTLNSKFGYIDGKAEVEDYIRYQIRNDSDLRLIGYVKDTDAYSSVSFTLTIDGRTTKALVCTTAYEALYANGELCTTQQIYGAEGYFVTYTINGYLNMYAGKEVTIIATYTDKNGDLVTKQRTVKIGSETNE